MGLTITVACLVELPVFHFMGNILSFVGVEQMLHWVLFFFLVSDHSEPKNDPITSKLPGFLKVWYLLTVGKFVTTRL